MKKLPFVKILLITLAIVVVGVAEGMFIVVALSPKEMALETNQVVQ